MPDIQRFAVFTIVSFALFLVVVLWVIRNRRTKPPQWSIGILALVVVPLGMTLARYLHLYVAEIPGAVYYGVPALITFLLPPFWLHMSRSEVVSYVPLAVLIAPAIHVVFSLFAGWHDYMPFPVYIPSLAELAHVIAR